MEIYVPFVCSPATQSWDVAGTVEKQLLWRDKDEIIAGGVVLNQHDLLFIHDDVHLVANGPNRDAYGNQTRGADHFIGQRSPRHFQGNHFRKLNRFHGPSSSWG